MGIFSVLTGIITQVAPKVLNVAKYAVNGIIDGVSKNGLAGYRLQLAGFEGGSHFVPGSLDGAINSEEADQEQVLNQHAGSPKEDVVAGLIAMKEMNNAVLLGSLVNMKMEDVILEATPSFYYSRKLNPGSIKDNVPVIGFDDHAYTHIIPKLFRNYDKLKQYDAFCLQYITVESTQLTTNITGTTVSFYPLTKDTRNMDNAVIKSAYNHQDSGAYSRIAYVIRNTTPGTFVNTSTGFYPENFQVLPNGAIRTEFLNKYNAIDTDQDGSSPISSFCESVTLSLKILLEVGIDEPGCDPEPSSESSSGVRYCCFQHEKCNLIENCIATSSSPKFSLTKHKVP